MKLQTAQTLKVSQKVDSATAQSAVRALAEHVGFDQASVEELALVTAELAANLVHHAGSGAITLTQLQLSEDHGIELETRDEGPGIFDLELAFMDGYSTSGGLGYGLGTINRFMDEVEVSSTHGSGTRLVCRRWVKACRVPPPMQEWEVGAATRSRRHARANGDAFVSCQSPGKLLVGLIDGLGHGESAQQAAVAARSYVHAHSEQPLTPLFAGASRACRATRGAVMALVRFESPIKMSFATLGNVQCRAWSEGEKTLFLSQRGILSSSDPKVVTHEIAWRPEWLLVMHTDGIRDKWRWNDFPAIERAPAQTVANRLLASLAHADDDASVIAVRHKR